MRHSSGNRENILLNYRRIYSVKDMRSSDHQALCVLSVFATFILRTNWRTFSKRSTKYLLLQGITSPYFVTPHIVYQKHKGCEQFRCTLHNSGTKFRVFKLYMKRAHGKLRILFSCNICIMQFARKVTM